MRADILDLRVSSDIVPPALWVGTVSDVEEDWDEGLAFIQPVANFISLGEFPLFSISSSAMALLSVAVLLLAIPFSPANDVLTLSSIKGWLVSNASCAIL